MGRVKLKLGSTQESSLEVLEGELNEAVDGSCGWNRSVNRQLKPSAVKVYIAALVIIEAIS